MVKWFKITQNQCIGFFAFGLVLFALQQIPYIIIPFIRMDSNILMEMQDKSALLSVAEKILGVSCIIIMLFLVRSEAQWFPLNTIHEKIYFGIAVMAIVV